MNLILTDHKLDPENVTCDFELALINAVTDQFPTVNVVGCLFHWKQALRRQMLKLGIDSCQVSDAMIPSKLDVFTVIPADDIVTRGIPCTKCRQ